MTYHLIVRRLCTALLCGAALSAAAANAWVSTIAPSGSISRFGTSGGSPTETTANTLGAVDLLLMPDQSQMLMGTVSQGSGSSNLVILADTRTEAWLDSYPVPGGIVELARNAAGRHAYATGLAGDGRVLLMSVDLQTHAVASAKVPDTTPSGRYPIGISADGTRLFVPTNHAIAIFDATTLATSGVIALPSNGIQAPPLATPDGTTLLATGHGLVYVIDLATRAVATTIAITAPAIAYGDALSPDGKTYYVSAGTLSAIDVVSRTVKSAVDLGQTNPYRLALSPDGTTLYAAELSYATTRVVDAATLTPQRTLHSLAVPWAVAVASNGQVLTLGATSNLVDRVDTSRRAAVADFMAGSAPGPGVFAAGRLFLPETANVAVHRYVDHLKAARPVAVNLMAELSMAAVGSKVYVNDGSQVRIIDGVAETVSGSFTIRVPDCSNGDLCIALLMAASGDGHSLLSSYLHIVAGGSPVAGGIVKIDTATGAQKRISSFPFLPGVVASDRAGSAAYAIAYNAPNQVGRWDTVDDRFVTSVTVPGNPLYVALAVDATGSVLYLLDNNGKIDLLDAASLQLLGSIAIGGHPAGIAVSGDGRQALVTDPTSSGVTLIDLTTSSVAATIDVGAPASGVVFTN